jgi:hypothetical protein
MAYNIDDVYQIVQYACGKNLQQGYISPADFNLTINQAQKSYASYLLGNFQQYQPGRPQARVEFGQNTVIRQRLTPIIYGYNLTIDATGFSPYPGDYLQQDAMWSFYGYNRIREVQQQYFYSIYNSVIDPVSSWPVYMLEYDGFRFFPNNTAKAKLSYVRNPPDMIWGYTLNVNGIPVYNPASSTQPVWDDASILEIIVRALRIIGVNLQYNDVNAYANEIKQIGQ